MAEENTNNETKESDKPNESSIVLTPTQPMKPQDIIKAIHEIDTKKLTNIVESVI